MNVCSVMCVLCLQIDHGQDVSWLSELREVSVLFINLDPGKETGPHEKQSLLQQSFDVVYPALTKFDGDFDEYNLINLLVKFFITIVGLLNKVFMFDKV